MQAGKIIRAQVKELENQAELIELIRASSKTEGGRMTQSGREFIAWAKKWELRQTDVAKILDISAGAVSNHYNN